VPGPQLPRADRAVRAEDPGHGVGGVPPSSLKGAHAPGRVRDQRPIEPHRPPSQVPNVTVGGHWTHAGAASGKRCVVGRGSGRSERGGVAGRRAKRPGWSRPLVPGRSGSGRDRARERALPTAAVGVLAHGHSRLIPRRRPVAPALSESRGSGLSPPARGGRSPRRSIGRGRDTPPAGWSPPCGCPGVKARARAHEFDDRLGARPPALLDPGTPNSVRHASGGWAGPGRVRSAATRAPNSSAICSLAPVQSPSCVGV
jgi:hypothetical protein